MLLTPLHPPYFTTEESDSQEGKWFFPRQFRKQSYGWNPCVLTPWPGVTAELIQTGSRGGEELRSGKRKEGDCRLAPLKSTVFKMEKNAFEKAFVTSGLSV